LKTESFKGALLSTLVITLLTVPIVSIVPLHYVSSVSAHPDGYENIVRGKTTAYNINQAGAPPWHDYPVGSRPLVMVAKRVGSGGVVAAGTVSTCRNGRWNSSSNPYPHFDILLDVAFQWMVPGAVNVLWYEGHSTYNNHTQCSELIAALGLENYHIIYDDTEPITRDLLGDNDILVIPQMTDPPSQLSDSEVQAIENFVKGGKGLLIMEGSDFGGHNFYETQNKVLTGLGFNVLFQDDQVSDSINNWGGVDYQPICDVYSTTDIGSAYENTTGENEIGLYSICSMAMAGVVLPPTILPDYQVGMPGTTLEYTVTVPNPYNPLAGNWTVSLSVSDTEGWNPTLDNENFYNVPPGESIKTTLRVAIPPDTPLCTEDNVTVSGVDLEHPEVQGNSTCTAHVGLRIEPTDDTYVSDQGPDANYNGENSLRIGRYYQYWQWDYLKFDLFNIPYYENITDARLYLFDYYAYSHGFDVRCCKVDDDSWLDTIVTWNTRPTPGAVLDTKYVDAASYDSPVSYYWDVTSFVKQEFAGDKTVSFCMLPPDNLDNSISRAFWSKERYENRTHPFLQIIYAVGPPPGHGVSVSISPSENSAENGQTVTFTVTVTNTGTVTNSYTLENTDNADWTKSLSKTSVGPLSPNASNTVTLSVAIPAGAENSDEDAIIVTATSTENAAVSDSASCVTHCLVSAPPQPGREVQVTISETSKSGAPGEELNFTVTVNNTGTSTDTFNLTTSDTENWGPTLSITSTTLAAGASRTGIRLSIIILSTAAEGDSTTITVTAKGTGYENSAWCTAIATKAPAPSGGVSPLLYVGAAVVIVVIIAAVLILKVV